MNDVERDSCIKWICGSQIIIWQDSYPVSPSSMFNEHCSGTISFLELGQLGMLYKPIKNNLQMSPQTHHSKQDFTEQWVKTRFHLLDTEKRWTWWSLCFLSPMHLPNHPFKLSFVFHQLRKTKETSITTKKYTLEAADMWRAYSSYTSSNTSLFSNSTSVMSFFSNLFAYDALPLAVYTDERVQNKSVE